MGPSPFNPSYLHFLLELVLAQQTSGKGFNFEMIQLDEDISNLSKILGQLLRKLEQKYPDKSESENLSTFQRSTCNHKKVLF